MDDWAQIRILRKDGMSIRKIAATVGCAKKTVERALASNTPASYSKRAPQKTAFDEVELDVRALLDEVPDMKATVIAQRVAWQGSMSWFRENIRRIRPEYLPHDPVDTLDHKPGVQIQCDLMFPDDGIPDTHGHAGVFPVLVMVASYSRFMAACVLPTRTTGDLVSGMWLLLQQRFGVVPKQLLWDHESGIGQKRLVDQVVGFSGTLGVRIKQAPPRDPETKGIVERHNEYLKTSFFPGRHFADHQDAQAQLDGWIDTIANTRVHASLAQRPVDRWVVDKAAMNPLPPYPPQTGLTRQVRLPRNYYVSVDANRYSVSPSAIGKIVTIFVQLDRVLVTDGTGLIVADHERVWGKNHTVTDPQHQRLAKQMRQQLAQPTPRLGDIVVETADLNVYDRLTGWQEYSA
ncbi:IS21 family transposase [Corynebacterium vitaeruminis]|jgi:transposase|nr:IS21 family transposase [Corynebacterium vitaeruminis]MCB0323673.1 IS21 family transposase [Bdellovibrionales bacterium]